MYKERTYIICLLLLVAIYEGMLCWQGFSMLDEGWVMSAYQWIFKDPESVQYQMLYYNGLIVGGLWEKMFGQWGYLGFRICSILFLEYIAIATYLLLRPYANRWCIIFGVFISIFIYGTGITVIHHNCVTAATVITAVYFIQRALCTSSVMSMAVAGLLVGINIFTRLPNISFCALILILIPYYCYTKSSRQTLILLGAAIGGIIAAIAIEIGFMSIMGHWEYFIDNIASGMSASSATDSTHRLSSMLPRYIDQYLLIGKHIAVFAVVPLMLWLSEKKGWHTTSVTVMKYVVLFVCMTVIVWKFEPHIIDLYAFITMVLALSLYRNRNNREMVFIVILALLVAYLQPLGSDWGVTNMGDQSIYIAVPLAVSVTYNEVKALSRDAMRVMTVYLTLCLVTLFAFVLLMVTHHCDFDDGPRWEKTYCINHPLATTYTQRNYADVVNELLPVLSLYVKDGDYMLCYPGFSTIHYLTHTRSYIGNTWTWTYDSGNLDRQLRIAEKKKKVLPVILIGKCSTLGDFTEIDPDWNNANAEETYAHHNNTIRVVYDFIKRNHYKIEWQDRLFQILIPDSPK